MGNQNAHKQFKRKQNITYSVQLMNLDMKIDLESVKFQQSPYNILEERFKPIPMMDKTVRDSEFCNVKCPQLSQNSLWTIKIYLNRNLPYTTYAQIDNIWRMTKYNQGGHFLQHCDRQKQFQGHVHFGTQIFIPPKKLVPHQGGELILKDVSHIEQIIASPDKWTHVIIPLGVAHQVKQVTEGFRISYVKEIWVQDGYDIETDQDRIQREHDQSRRIQIYQEQQRSIQEHQQWLQNRWKNRRNLPPGHRD